MIVDTVNELRERLLHAKGLLTIGDLAEQTGLTRQTMGRFLRGGYPGLSTLEAVERWLVTHESPSHG